MNRLTDIFRHVPAMAAALMLLGACSQTDDIPGEGDYEVPDGMVEVRPVMPVVYDAIPRTVAKSRVYDPRDSTESKLDPTKLKRLPEGSTVWLIASQTDESGKTMYVKKSYVVYNPEEETGGSGNQIISYLVPCTVNDHGDVMSMESAPLYLEHGSTYTFSAISPARKLNEDSLKVGKITFMAHNGDAFYANDGRYACTTPHPVTVVREDNKETCQVTLSHMINQTAQLRFLMYKGEGVHDLDIQPSGIELSGVQYDGDQIDGIDGVQWHMSTGKYDEPFRLRHGRKLGTYNFYNYTINPDESVSIEVPVLPMYGISKPVMVLFRLKINGVPTTYQMMLNEKDFKAGYSYGYRGTVSTDNLIDVEAWQFVSWTYDFTGADFTPAGARN